MKDLLLFIGLLCLQSGVSRTQKPFKTICHGEVEISFFDSKKLFGPAKQACVDYGGHLVKVDSAAIQQAIENALGEPDGERYYIGGEQGPNGNFMWVINNTKVGENGYTNWKPGQPNHMWDEDCLGLGDHKQYQWSDVACTFEGSESRYICQKTTRTFALSTIRKDRVIACQSSVSGVSVKWTRNSQQIKTVNESGVYQVLSADKSVLMLANANMSYTGTYTCFGILDCVTKRRDVKVAVVGTPTIHKIENSKCNGSLFVTWKPNIAAVGFPHRIAVTRGGNSDLFASPDSNDIYRTEYLGLDFDTKYTVEITACPTKQSCNTGYRAEATNKTNGIYGLISSAVLANDGGGGCKVSWWPPGDDRIFTLTTSCSIDESRYPREKEFAYTKAQGLKSTNYLFQPSPNRKCEVSVQVQECVGASKALAAKGFCVTPTKEPSYVEPPIIYGALQGNSKLMIKVSNPSEENGLISCVFLIVCYGDCWQENFTIDNLDAANTTVGDMNAIAITTPMSQLLLPIGPLTPSAHYFELSDGNITQCNVYNTSASNSTDVANRNFQGRNVIANTNVNVGAFLVTSTPSDGRVLLKSSPVVIIRNKTVGEVVTMQNETKGHETETSEPINGNDWIAGLAVGVGLIGVVIGAVSQYAFMWLKQRADKLNNENNRGENARDSTHSTRPPEPQQEHPFRRSYENFPETPAYEEIGDGNKGTSTYESYNA